jgi:serine protease Do
MSRAIQGIVVSVLVLGLSACARGATLQSPRSSPSTSTSASSSPSNASSPSSSSMPSSASSNNSTNISADANAAMNVVKKLQPSVVRVSVTSSAPQRGPFGNIGGPPQGQGVGTGMVIDDQGHILTNNHVVTLESSKIADSVSVDLPNGKTAKANVVGNDPQTDLAVLQVGNSDRDGLTPIQWADPNSIAVGEQAIAIGYALDLGGAPTVTEGVVSAVDRSIPEQDATISGAVQTDAAINPGNSGGPLLDLNAKVIGVNTAGPEGSGNQPVQGLNFAISVATAQPIAQDLMAHGKVTRGYMGVGVTDITPELAQANSLGVNHGAGVGEVTSGSPADKGGLQAGDVITKVGDVDINNTGDLTRALTKYGPGQNVPVNYFRNGKQATTTINLGQRPSNS